MEITNQPGEHRLSLNDEEASTLVDACALLVLATESEPNISLPPGMANLLCNLFSGLKVPAEQPSSVSV